MTKKKPTIKDVDSGLRGIYNMFRLYIEYKGDAVGYNQFLNGKAKEQEEINKRKETKNDA